MNSELYILTITSASVAFIHTLSGPDHYLPFIVISKAKKWKMRKTILFTSLCGIGHVGSSVILGLIGVAFGIAIGNIELWEGVRGSIVSWIFTLFGLLYLIWGIRQTYKNKSHSHVHYHLDEGQHVHEHNHHHHHAHVHETEKKKDMTPWILFTIFVFGPCEPLIPIVMFPAAKNNYAEMILVTLVFSLVTILTMIVLVTVTLYGFKILPVKLLERHYHTLAGVTIFLCGLGMIFLGL